MTSIAFVTTCKGRLHHLQETLPLLVAQAPDEIIVVDYGCPQGAGDWVEEHHPQVSVVRVTDDPGFCTSRARNLGAARSTSQWVCFIDADVRVNAGWVAWLRGNLHSKFFYRAAPVDGKRDKNTWGTVVCTKRALDAIEGYDEAFRGWGGDDDDLYERLTARGLAENVYPSAFVDAIGHDDADRVTFHEVKDVDASATINMIYMAAKRQVAHVTGRKVALQTRLDLMGRIKRDIMAWRADPSSPMPRFTFTVNGVGWLPEPFRMLKEVTFTLAVGERVDRGSTAPGGQQGSN